MAITKIQSESLNLADTYAFTGTVTGAGGVNTPSFLAKRNSDQSVSNNTDTKVAFDNVVYDTASDYDNTTNYRWTVSVAGKYFVYAQIMCDSTAGTNALESGLGWFKLNGTDMSRYQGISQYPNKTFNEIHVYMGQVWDLSVNDYIEIFGHVGGSSGTSFVKSTFETPLASQYDFIFVLSCAIVCPP